MFILMKSVSMIFISTILFFGNILFGDESYIRHNFEKNFFDLSRVSNTTSSYKTRLADDFSMDSNCDGFRKVLRA